MLAALALIFALTRAEIVERFRAPAITKANGLVQVIADCPADMRREYQMDVAAFAARICNALERKERMHAARFSSPGIMIFIGDERTNRTDVVASAKTRRGGSRYTRIYLPAPGFSDVERLRLEVAKAFYYAVKGDRLDDEDARRALVETDQSLRVREEYGDLAKWYAGELAPQPDESPDEFDERMLKLARSVILPGHAAPSDVLHFAGRLRFYPAAFDVPYAGRLRSCTFAEAIELAQTEPRIRLQAFEKAPFIVAFGGGRSPELAAAANAYSAFLFELAKYKMTKDELAGLLAGADALLAEAFAKAKDAYGAPGGRY